MKMDRDYIAFAKLCNASIKESISDDDRQTITESSQILGSDELKGRTEKAKMQPFIARAMIESGIDLNYWQPIIERYRERNEKVVRELNYIHTALQEAGVRKFFLTENFAAMLLAGGDIGMFASGDVDHCCDISENVKINEVLAELGYSAKERYSGKLLISTEYSNHNRLPENFHVGIQYEPLARLTMPSFVHLDDFIDWSKCSKYADTNIILPPADALMYICLLHISIHSFCRAPGVRLYRDVINCACKMTELDWRNIEAWSASHKTYRRTMTALCISREITGISIPIELPFASRDINRIEKLVLDYESKTLSKDLSRLSVLSVELCCDPFNPRHGACAILRPEKVWLEQVYGSSGVGSIIKNIIKAL